LRNSILAKQSNIVCISEGQTNKVEVLTPDNLRQVQLSTLYAVHDDGSKDKITILNYFIFHSALL